jgi:hypothetical protein
MLRLFLVSAGALLLVSGAAARTQPPRMVNPAARYVRVGPPTSSVDARHAWRMCAPRDLCETNDGGHRWHRIFRVPLWDREQYSRDPQISDLIRWSVRTGIVVVQPYNYVFWTRDSGRRWFHTHVFSTAPPSWCLGGYSGPPFCTGTLSLQQRRDGLYFDRQWTYDSGCPYEDCQVHREGTLHYRTEGWPPRQTPRCVSGWLNALYRLPKSLKPNGLYDPTRKLTGHLPNTGNLCADDLWGDDKLQDGMQAVLLEDG